MSEDVRILVVEDDEDMREVLVDTLEDEGYDVSAAASSTEAVTRAERVRYDLVVTDVRMAGRDGIETLGELRRLNPRVKSIVITGYASDEAPARAIREQASDYLYKPFSRNDLLLSVRCVLLAREEKGRLQTLVDGVRRMVAAAGTVLASRALASTEEPRERAFLGFYVGIRSRKLTPATAYALWEQLEALEREREALKEGRGEVQHVVDGYQYVADVLAAFARDQLASMPVRGATGPTRERFGRLYKGIAEGRVLPHQLTLAPFLRTLDWRTLSSSSELQAMYREMWGDPPAA